MKNKEDVCLFAWQKGEKMVFDYETNYASDFSRLNADIG